MSSNSRLTVATHILAWMALVARKDRGPVTSDRIARSVNTNPVIIPRALGALSKRGLVQSRRGAHAGWTSAKRPDGVSLLDVYRAVDDAPTFALHGSRPCEA